MCPASGNCNVRSGLGEGQGDAAANAAASACDDGHMPVKPELIENAHTRILRDGPFPPCATAVDSGCTLSAAQSRTIATPQNASGT